MADEYLFLSSLLLILLSCIAFRKKPKGLPPGPPPLFLLGNLLHLGQLPHRSLAELARRHGPLMSLRLGLVPYVVVSSPAIAKQVLHKHDQALSYRAPLDATRAHNHDKLSMVHMSPGAPWRSLRKLCNANIFSSRRLDAGQGLRSRKVSELVSFLKKSAKSGKAVDIGQAVFTTTLNLMSTTIFSEDVAEYEGSSSAEFKDLIRQLMIDGGGINVSDYYPLLRGLDLQGRRRRTGACVRKLKDIFDKKIEDRREPRFLEGSSLHGDFLDVLLDANTSGELDHPTIGALLVDLFTAGSDTSSATVQWAMAELLRNPRSLEEARREVADAMAGSQKEAVEESDIGRMPFLQAVVKETLRLHPPVPFLIPRRASQTVRIEIDEATDYTVLAETRILVNVWAIGRDPSLWGSDAGVFRPERFMEGEFRHADYRGNHMELIPFGSGRRICPGVPLASRMVHLLLANLLWFFDWKLPEGTVPADISMTENFGFTLDKAEPLVAVPVLSRG